MPNNIPLGEFDLATAKLSQVKSILATMYGDSYEGLDNNSDEIKANVYWACESLVAKALELWLFGIIHGLIQRRFSPRREARKGFYLHIQIDKTFTIYLLACLAALREHHHFQVYTLALIS